MMSFRDHHSLCKTEEGQIISEKVYSSVIAQMKLVYQQTILGSAITSPAAQPGLLTHTSHQKLSTSSKLQGIDKPPGRQAPQFMQDFAHFTISHLP
jgi:hypothetical protein